MFAVLNEIDVLCPVAECLRLLGIVLGTDEMRLALLIRRTFPIGNVVIAAALSADGRVEVDRGLDRFGGVFLRNILHFHTDNGIVARAAEIAALIAGKFRLAPGLLLIQFHMNGSLAQLDFRPDFFNEFGAAHRRADRHTVQEFVPIRGFEFLRTLAQNHAAAVVAGRLYRDDQRFVVVADVHLHGGFILDDAVAHHHPHVVGLDFPGERQIKGQRL